MAPYDRVVHFDYKYLLPFAARLPLRWAYLMADFRGWMQHLLRPDSRRYAREHLGMVFPRLSQKEIRSLALRHYMTPARDELEACWYDRPFSFFDGLADAQGRESLTDALQAGQGALLFSGHLGSTGFFFCYAGKSGIPMNIIGRPIDPEAIPLHPTVLEFNRRRVKGIEEAVSNPFILTGRGKFAEILEKLRRGEIVMSLVDVAPIGIKRTSPVVFLGLPARLPDGIAHIFRETGCRLIHWSIHHDPRRRRHSIRLQDVSREVIREEPRAAVLQKLVGCVERQILRHPEDWWCWDSLNHYLDDGRSLAESGQASP
jgi:lauroyl/myristoyl acyltransferase